MDKQLMFAYKLFDRINTNKLSDIEHTLFDRTDERSLDMQLGKHGYFDFLTNMVFRKNLTF